MKDPETHRVRTVTWEDPAISRRDATVITGLDYLLAIKEGRIKQPPVARLIGYRIREVERGRAVFELEPAEYHYNPFATVHGGIMATLLDSAMAAAVLSTLPIGLTCSTIEMKVNFVRPGTGTVGVLRGEGSVIHVGSTIATAEGKTLDSKGKLYAHAVSTCSISSLKSVPS
jgi:uncharacterized protein (TIGR00369 family)